MQNCKTSVGTAAQQSSKRSLLFRQAPILAILMLAAVLCKGQALSINPIGTFKTDTTTTVDTIKVVLLVSDTAINYYTTKNTNAAPIIIKAYSVRRKECCINGNTGNLAYYQPIPYYTHLLYLDDKKQPLKSTVIVWQSVSAK